MSPAFVLSNSTRKLLVSKLFECHNVFAHTLVVWINEQWHNRKNLAVIFWVNVGTYSGNLYFLWFLLSNHSPPRHFRQISLSIFNESEL